MIPLRQCKMLTQERALLVNRKTKSFYSQGAGCLLVTLRIEAILSLAILGTRDWAQMLALRL
jgi:hypothetical protein